MKVVVDIIGVEQSVNFTTMQTQQVVTMNILGTEVRVPITEAQLENLTTAAVNERTAPAGTWDETREVSLEAPDDRTSTPVPVREFSQTPDYGGVMQGLTDEAVEAPPTELEGFFDESEEAKAAKLRAKKPQRRTVPRDEAGNPVTPQYAAAPMLRQQESDDDGFHQG